MLVSTTQGDQHLFPLSLVLGGTVGAMYYVSEDGKVWSNRGSKTAVCLLGSRTKSGTYFKFGNRFGSPQRLDDIVKTCKAHPRWLVEVGRSKEIVLDKKTKASAKKTGDVDVNTAIKARGSVIGRVHKGHLVFGSEPKIHLTPESLKTEMLRLATQYPGVKFVQLDIKAAVQSGGVTWE